MKGHFQQHHEIGWFIIQATDGHYNALKLYIGYKIILFPIVVLKNQFNHTLPQRVLIPRSSGENTLAFTRSQEYGSRIRKSRSKNDTEERIYVRVSWVSDTMTKEQDNTRETPCCFDGLFKDIDLEDIVKLNPEIKEQGVEYILNYIKVEESMNEMQKQVIEKCNERLEEWGKTIMHPIFRFLRT